MTNHQTWNHTLSSIKNCSFVLWLIFMAALLLRLEPEDMSQHGDKGPNANVTKLLKNTKKIDMFINVPFSLL